MVILYSSIALVAAYLLDLLLGDPPHWPHLIRLVGRLSTTLEKVLYRGPLRRQGFFHLSLMLLLIVVPLFLLLLLAWSISPFLFLAVDTIISWQLLATKSLRDESNKVCQALKTKDVTQARQALSMIVGRDPSSLDETGITRATVETIAENTSDGVIAPLFYMMLGGSVLGLAYKVVNTLDSMIGYRNERYRDYGFAAAKLDDILNWIPSRLAAIIMIGATAICQLDTTQALHIWKRDRLKHASPNSAQTEAVVAGALDIQLGGDSVYFGKIVSKPTIGDDIRPIEIEDIRRTHRLLYWTSFFMLLIAILFRGWLLATL